jgi:hypothetical protein
MIALHVTISDEAHDGWRNFCAVHGINITALAEAIGLSLGQLDDPETELPPQLRETVIRARRIAAERIRRRP